MMLRSCFITNSPSCSLLESIIFQCNHLGTRLRGYGQVLSAHDLHHQAAHVGRVKRVLPRHHLVHAAPQRPHVALVVVRLAGHHLGRPGARTRVYRFFVTALCRCLDVQMQAPGELGNSCTPVF